MTTEHRLQCFPQHYEAVKVATHFCKRNVSIGFVYSLCVCGRRRTVLRVQILKCRDRFCVGLGPLQRWCTNRRSACGTIPRLMWCVLGGGGSFACRCRGHCKWYTITGSGCRRSSLRPCAFDSRLLSVHMMCSLAWQRLANAGAHRLWRLRVKRAQFWTLNLSRRCGIIHGPQV